MKNLTFTIAKKELARFFGDRALLFTAVIMPGLLIYLVYTAMGVGIDRMDEETDTPTTVYVENLSPSLAPLFDDMSVTLVETGFSADSVIAEMASKDANLMLVAFPAELDNVVAARQSGETPSEGVLAPNIRIWHNSLCNTADANYRVLTDRLNDYESLISNVYDINRVDEEGESYDQATAIDEIGNLMKSLFPMLLMMLIFSGCMAVAPNAIAGEKERGTIATLLVTPMKRSQLALGKIVALSLIVLLSGLSSFLGIIFSIPNLFAAEGLEISLAGIYSPTDYALLLLLIFSTTLLMVSAVSIISAWAKDVKQAGTMVTPFMLVVMFCGLLPMLQPNAHISSAAYLIPFYNSVQCMSGVFTFDLQLMPMLLTIGSNLCYAGIAVFVITRLFSSERVMFGR